MRVRIWAEQEPLSPDDTGTVIWADVDLKLDLTPAQAQQLVIDLAGVARLKANPGGC